MEIADSTTAHATTDARGPVFVLVVVQRAPLVMVTCAIALILAIMISRLGRNRRTLAFVSPSGNQMAPLVVEANGPSFVPTKMLISGTVSALTASKRDRPEIVGKSQVPADESDT